MKNLFRLIALSCLLLGCNPAPEPAPVESTPAHVPVETETPVILEEPAHETSTPIGPEYPVAEVKKVFTVKIEDTNYNQAQKAKLAEAEKLITKIFNSEDYKKEVLSRKFSYTKLSSEEIYEKLFKGAEALQPAVNYQMDLKVTMYYEKLTKVVGYTTAKTLVVKTNSKYHNGYTACQVASNLTHEWTHKMGFDHSSAGDYDSVPYAHNAIILKLCPKFL